MAGLPPQVKRAREKQMQSQDAAFMGTHTIQDGGHGTMQACIPSLTRENFGAEVGAEIDTYVDFENQAVIHVFGGDDE